MTRGAILAPERKEEGADAAIRAASCRVIATEASRPHPPRHVRLRFEPVREKYVVLAPERLLWPDAVAVAIRKLCDGRRDLAAIADLLADMRCESVCDMSLADIWYSSESFNRCRDMDGRAELCCIRVADELDHIGEVECPPFSYRRGELI